MFILARKSVVYDSNLRSKQSECQKTMVQKIAAHASSVGVVLKRQTFFTKT